MEPMEFVQHPGPMREQRWLSIAIPHAQRQRVRVPQGEDLFEYLEDLISEIRVDGASFRIIAGQLQQLSLRTGGRGTDTPMAFHGPFKISAPVSAHSGSGIIGFTEEGDLTTHCHAVFRRENGHLVGGHLIKGEAVAGELGVEVELTTFNGAKFVRAPDAETGFVIFRPERT